MKHIIITLLAIVALIAGLVAYEMGVALDDAKKHSTPKDGISLTL